jgi:hypothetical protein
MCKVTRGEKYYCDKSKRQVCDCDICEYPDVVSLSDGRLAVSKCCLAIFDICDSGYLRRGSVLVAKIAKRYNLTPSRSPVTCLILSCVLR